MDDADRPERRRPDDVPRMPPERVDGWAQYPETVLRLGRAARDGRSGDAALEIDLREPAPPDAVRAFARLGLDGPFAVVTACRPAVAFAQDDHDDGADPHEALREALARASGRTPVPADGASPDGAHVEHGWAAVLLADDAWRIAARFGQAAIFRWDGRAFLIDPVLVDAPIRPLPEGPGPRTG